MPVQSGPLIRNLEQKTSRLFRAITENVRWRNRVSKGVGVRLEIAKTYAERIAKRYLSNGAPALREQKGVRDQYESRWAGLDIRINHGHKKTLEFQGAVFEIAADLFLNWFYVVALAEVIETTKAKRLLEVGSGNGFNLVCLALLFPEISFTGIELTNAGVERANRLRADSVFRRTAIGRLSGFIDRRVSDSTEPINVEFVRGDAGAMSFPSYSFDLVFTVLALEQMNRIKDRVLAEIARVTRGQSVHIEPFLDFNREWFKRLHLGNKDYFRSEISYLRQFSLEPAFSWAGFPDKLHFSSGIVMAEKMNVPAVRV